MAGRQLLTIGDFSAETLSTILQRASEFKAMHRAGQAYTPMSGQTVATSFSDDLEERKFPCLAALYQLGAHSVEWQIKAQHEPQDALSAQLLNRMVDVAIASTSSHERLRALATRIKVPLINAGTDQIDPVSFLADAQAFCEQKTTLRGKTVAWIGPADARCHAYIQGAVRCGFNLKLFCPADGAPDESLLSPTRAIVSVVDTPEQALDGCELFVFEKLVDAQGQSLPEDASQKLLASLPKEVRVIPGARGGEIEEDSILARSLENRLHVWKAILEWVAET